MLPDLHLHTSRCGHATGKMEEYIAVARSHGITHLGFADHIPMYWLPSNQRDTGLAMAEEELPRYVQSVVRLQEENPDMIIDLGIEADYIPGYEDRLWAVIARHSFDYVLGSVHYMDGWGFDNPALVEEYTRRDVDELYRQYFDLVQEAVRSGLFDVIAHPDLIKKFGYLPRGDLQALYDQTARVMAGGDICVEVNTAGLRMAVGEIYPSLEFLKLCYRYGVPVTVGSDAHRPDQVGHGWLEAKEWLKAAGYREIAVFKGRRRRLISF